MVRIGLHGELAQKIGKDELHYSVNTGAEVFQAISVNYPWFRRWLIEKEKMGIFFRIIVDGEIQEKETLLRNKKNISEVEIVPAIVGAGTEIFIALAISALVSGITYLITPQPEIPRPDTSQTVNAGADSFQFGGRINRLRQGTPVPLAYGRIKIGSSIISAALESKNLAEIEATTETTKALRRYTPGTTILFSDFTEIYYYTDRNQTNAVRFENYFTVAEGGGPPQTRLRLYEATVTSSYVIDNNQVRVDFSKDSFINYRIGIITVTGYAIVTT